MVYNIENSVWSIHCIYGRKTVDTIVSCSINSLHGPRALVGPVSSLSCEQSGFTRVPISCCTCAPASHPRAHNAMDPHVYDSNAEKPVYGVHLETAAMIQVQGSKAIKIKFQW